MSMFWQTVREAVNKVAAAVEPPSTITLDADELALLTTSLKYAAASYDCAESQTRVPIRDVPAHQVIHDQGTNTRGALDLWGGGWAEGGERAGGRVG